MQKTARKYHKWLMAFVGVQFMVWTITGAYMVFFDIHYIHGDTLVHNHQTKIDPSQLKVSIAELHRQYGDRGNELENLSLGTLLGKSVYRFAVAQEHYVVDAQTGEQLAPISKALAIKLAQAAYTGDGEVIGAQLIEDNPPFELSPRRIPAWRVDFEDFGAPALYISANSGEVVTKRHQWWRIFDWMFRFHVMDYEESEIDNSLLFWFALAGLIAAITGGVLTYQHTIRPTIKNSRPIKSLTKQVSSLSGSR